MEAISYEVNRLIKFYEWCLTRADTRVEEWLFMQSPLPTLALTALYVFLVVVGPIYMRSREPVNLKWTLFLYNAGLVALNFYICKELIVNAWRLSYNITCQTVDYSDNPLEVNIAKALWWYYFSKLVEFLDTICFVLRKKNSQISFLHVYHHATMFPLWWIGVKWVAGGQSLFGATMNSFVHILMYTYYGLSVLGPGFHKYLWWKKHLTWIQLVQFVVGITHAINSLRIGCKFPEWMHYALLAYGTSILLLFVNFYVHAYVKRLRLPKTEAARCKAKDGAEQCTNGEVHLANGFAGGDATTNRKKDS